MGNPESWYWLGVLVCDFIVLIACWSYWIHARRKSPGLKFNFGITDIWGLILGLSPVLAYAGHALKSGSEADPTLVALFLIPHQLAGVFLCVLRTQEAGVVQAPALHSVMTAFGGAILGATLLSSFSIAALFFLILVAVTFPISLPIVFVLILGLFRKPREKAE